MQKKEIFNQLPLNGLNPPLPWQHRINLRMPAAGDRRTTNHPRVEVSEEQEALPLAMYVRRDIGAVALIDRREERF